jgi:hypothetical protein
MGFGHVGSGLLFDAKSGEFADPSSGLIVSTIKKGEEK